MHATTLRAVRKCIHLLLACMSERIKKISPVEGLVVILPEGQTVYGHRAGRRLIKVLQEGDTTALAAATLPDEGQNLLFLWFRVESVEGCQQEKRQETRLYGLGFCRVQGFNYKFGCVEGPLVQGSPLIE
jgi:hypothetical protein